MRPLVPEEEPNFLDGYVVGIYYDSTSKINMERADEIKNQLESWIDSQQILSIVRKYPKESSFFEGGLAFDGNDIRYENLTEKKAAEILLKELEDKYNFTLKPVTNSTPNFISIFLSSS